MPTLLCVIAAIPRLTHLGIHGFAEDEVDKLRAVIAYQRGEFTADAEHPMLMKIAALASVKTTIAWNRVAAPFGGPTVTLEGAIRAPSAIAGALTTGVLFLLFELLFDRRTALVASVLWALDVNAIAVNRIAKEDSLLVLFLFAAAWYYERGKRVGVHDPDAAQKWFRRCGAAFGAMLASKYMPYWYGIHVIFFRAATPHQGRNRPDKRPFYLAMLAAFLMTNFAILMPANWEWIASYVREMTMTHTGYVFAGRVYVNKVSATPWGVPPWFYVTYLATKVPLPVLAAFGLGLWQLVARRRDRGFVFARVFLVFMLLPYSLAATKFVRYMLPLYAIFNLVAALGLAWVACRARGARSMPARLVGSAVTVVVIASQGMATLKAAPHYSLSQNAFGAVVAGEQLLFPHDELFDAGVREAVKYVAAAAQPDAVVMSEAPAVVRTYLEWAGRHDVDSRALARGRWPRMTEDAWILVQDGRIYLENEALIQTLRQRRRPVHEIRIHGYRAVQIFRGW